MATLYLDVTKTIADGIHTGIQRVVRQVAARAMRMGPDLGLSVVPVVTEGRRYHRLDARGLEDLVSQGPAAGVAVFAPQSDLARAAKRRISGTLPRLYALLVQRAVRRRMAAVIARGCDPEPIVFAPGDTVVMMDSPFGGPSVEGIAMLQRAGIATIVVVYDMIMLTHPEMVTPFATWSFDRYLLQLAPRSRGILTISRDVTHEVARFLADRGIAVPIRHFYLGHDLTDTRGAPGEAVALPDAIWVGGDPVFLMLGNLDARKGHGFVLDAFDALWARGVNARLLVIGKTVGGMTALLDRFADHPERGRRLFLVHGASDADVASAIARSTAGIIAAVVEGFGLPLVEFLAAGLPVLASDIPVFREIADGHATFFDRGDPLSLAAAVGDTVRDPAPGRAAAADFRWIDWQEATSQFLTGVETLLAERRVAASPTDLSARAS